jgi:hypothetical protein
MRYDFLVETYDTERIKVMSVWSEFRDEDLPVRPRPGDPRGRSVREQMIHQCVSEELWFRTMLGIDVEAPPLPALEARLEFIKRYAEDSGKRLAVLQNKPETWWEADTNFHATYARTRVAQQLRADRRHRRPDARPRADDLCLFQSRHAAARGILRWRQVNAPTSRR